MGQIRKRDSIYWIRYYPNGPRFERRARAEGSNIRKPLITIDRDDREGA